MSVTGAWQRYAHLDHLLSDAAWLPATFEAHILRDLWLTIRERAREEGAKVPEGEERKDPRTPTSELQQSRLEHS